MRRMRGGTGRMPEETSSFRPRCVGDSELPPGERVRVAEEIFDAHAEPVASGSDSRLLHLSERSCGIVRGVYREGIEKRIARIGVACAPGERECRARIDRKSTRLNSSHQ